jgi:hypothetical protein
MIRRFHLTPKCCTTVENFKTVFLRYKDEPDFSYSEEQDKVVGDGYHSMKPTWAIKAVSTQFDSCETWADAAFCPHCGTAVPDLERNPTAKGKKFANNDDDYCATCKQRNMACECVPSWFAWRPVGVETEIPKKKNH